MDGELMTTVEAAKYLSVSPEFMESYGRKKGPPHIHLGPRAVRYRKSDLDAWVESCVCTSTEDAIMKGFKMFGKPKGWKKDVK